LGVGSVWMNIGSLLHLRGSRDQPRQPGLSLIVHDSWRF
jgi:hypothetical protein